MSRCAVPRSFGNPLSTTAASLLVFFVASPMLELNRVASKKTETEESGSSCCDEIDWYIVHQRAVGGLRCTARGISSTSVFSARLFDARILHCVQTWMAYAASDAIWSATLAPFVREDLVLIATTIAQYEPVHMLVSPGADHTELVSFVGNNPNITITEQPLNDLWMRDTGPVFVNQGAMQKAVGFNFNG